MIEQRSSTRHGVDLPVQLKIAQEEGSADSADNDSSLCHETMQNISMGGAQLSCDSPFPLGTKAEITFRIPTQEEAIVVDAVVRWNGGSSMGLQFGSLRAREVWSLGEYFKSLTDSSQRGEVIEEDIEIGLDD